MGESSKSKARDAVNQTAAKAKKKTMSQAARRMLSAKLKAYWAQKKARQK